ncbi:MAG: glycosyltransferase family 2 protein [Bacteroidetes bacterium]|nr:glycosyltransferase family 2 protein [Bacteroidota bacterium]
MKFSIVVPAYNAEESIGYTVRSVVEQSKTISRSSFEVIVVDNNSTDKTREVALEAGADVVAKEKLQGTNIARNRGYLESRGEIIVFLDADSEAPEDWLIRIGEAFEDPTTQAISGPYDYGFTRTKAIAEAIYTRIVFPSLPKLLRLLFRKKAAIIIGGNFAVRRSTIEKIGGLPPLTFWGDDAAIAMAVVRRVGKVRFISTLRVKSSHKRFDRDGFLILAGKYARAYFRVYFGLPK